MNISGLSGAALPPLQLNLIKNLIVLGLLLLRPIRLLRRSLNTFGEGDWDLRISQTRRDEIGEIYSAFNRMAEKVQSRLSQDEETRPQADVPVLDIPPDAVVPETTIRAEILRA